jgi:zinc transport system substrate-binding protein
MGCRCGGKKRTGAICAQHPAGRSGKWCLSPLSLLALVLIVIAGGAGYWLASAQAPPATGDRAVIDVVAGIPPLGYMVERIGGPRVRVHVLVRPGQDPHTFEPAPQQVMALAKAAIFFKIGMPFESQLAARVAQYHPQLLVIDTSRGIHKRPMEDDDDDEHGQGAPSDADEQGDPHVWLAPSPLKTIAANVADGLCRCDPPHAAQYRGNLAALLGELDALDQRLRTELAPYRGQSFFVFHPTFGYFADAYGLRQEAIEMGGKSPLPRQLRALVHRALAEHVRVVFLQPELDARSVEALALAIHGVATPLDALRPNVIENLDHVAAEIVRAMASREVTPPRVASDAAKLDH